MEKQLRIQNKVKQGVLSFLALLFVFALPVLANDSAGVLISPDYIEADETEEPPPLPTPPPLRWQPHMVADRTPRRIVNNIQLRGVFPDVTPAFGPAYTVLNERILAAADALVDNALSRRARTVTFSYEVFATHDVVSIVMYASIEAITTREAVATVNFDPLTGRLLTVSCVMGADFPPLAERILTEWTRDNPERYYAAVTAPLSAFYITNDKLVLLFDELQVSTVVGELTRMDMQLRDIVRVRPIPPIEYQVRADLYNLKFVPVETVLGYLGYTLTYDPDTGFLRVWNNENDPQPVSQLRAGLNHYTWTGTLPRTLEFHPMRSQGRMMVPITFFDRVVPRTTYYIDSNGFIHFLAYRRR